jgi:hypothetical protein
MDYKIIQDSIHGSVRVSNIFLDLIQTPEMQRLYGIKQLGPTYLVYPGANHTRFEHSLGAYHVAKRMGNAIGLEEEDKKLLRLAALLHDVGHGPYSHTLEYIYKDLLGIDHREVSCDVVEGKYDIIKEKDREVLESKRIPEILENYGIHPKDVSRLINSFPRRKRYLGQMIHGGIDVDKIDYLLRDAHYTGAVHGVIDLSRLLEVLAIHRNELVVNKKGITSIEEMLVGRTLMFLSVYLHKTVRIIEGMMGRAVERISEELGDFQRMNDSEFMEFLLNYGGYAGEIARMIKYRNLFKLAYSFPARELDERGKERLSEIGKTIESRRDFEKELCKKAKIREGYAIVDIPLSDKILVSELRSYVKEIRILDNGKLKPIEDYTSLEKFLNTRSIPDWGIMVCSPSKYKEKVRKVVERILW